jgi:hypothetical protein
MILVTGGTGLVGAHLLLHIIASDDNQSKVRYLSIAYTIEKQNLYLIATIKQAFDRIEWFKQIFLIFLPRNCFSRNHTMYTIVPRISLLTQEKRNYEK